MIGTIVVLKFWTFISYFQKKKLDHVRAISYNPQKDISKGVLHTLIKYHLTLALRGFMIEGQIFNLIFEPFFLIINHACHV
jgi:hypothetical protein